MQSPADVPVDAVNYEQTSQRLHNLIFMTTGTVLQYVDSGTHYELYCTTVKK
jgi:hypothetical protein